MPLLGCNWHEGLPLEDHVWFRQFEEQAPVMKFFLEPVVLTINYGEHDRLFLAGLRCSHRSHTDGGHRFQQRRC